MYEFVQGLIGTVPEEFAFVYTIVTIILSIAIIGSFTSIFYFILRLIRGAL